MERVKVDEMVESKAEQLERLGMTQAAKEVREQAIFRHKCIIAYEHYRYVRPEKIEAFNAKLKEKTSKDYRYDTLKFTNLEEYSEVPPQGVLDLLEQARDKKCFDRFEIAKIESVEERPDPILFGRIKGCPDRFFIGQWDDDVKIEDILQENEG